MTTRDYDIGPVEIEVLKALWELGPSNVRGVLESLEKQGRSLAYTTVQTLLTRLEHKGFVRSNKSGPAYVYRAAITRDRISRSRWKKLLDQLYDGAAGPLVLQLLRSERLTPDEIDELQKLIDRLDQRRE